MYPSRFRLPLLDALATSTATYQLLFPVCRCLVMFFLFCFSFYPSSLIPFPLALHPLLHPLLSYLLVSVCLPFHQLFLHFRSFYLSIVCRLSISFSLHRLSFLTSLSFLVSVFLPFPRPPSLFLCSAVNMDNEEMKVRKEMSACLPVFLCLWRRFSFLCVPSVFLYYFSALFSCFLIFCFGTLSISASLGTAPFSLYLPPSFSHATYISFFLLLVSVITPALYGHHFLFYLFMSGYFFFFFSLVSQSLPFRLSLCLSFYPILL